MMTVRPMLGKDSLSAELVLFIHRFSANATRQL